MPDSVRIPAGVTFVFGGISGMGAAVAAQPMDLVKNRMQMSADNLSSSMLRSTRSSLQCARFVYKNEGFCGFYSGLSASFARQLTYTTTRFGIYNFLLERSGTSFASKVINASIARVYFLFKHHVIRFHLQPVSKC